MNGDRALVPLFKTAAVIFIILIVGVMLNLIASRKDRIIAERDRQTVVRISLVREEYERKIEDLESTCEQKVQQIMNLMKKSKLEELEKQKKELEEKFATELRSQSEQIENIRTELKKIEDHEPNRQPDQKELKPLEKIQELLSKVKAQILMNEREITNNYNDKSNVIVEEDKNHNQVTNQLDRRK